MTTDTGKRRVLLFGDSVLDIYDIRYESPGGFGDAGSSGKDAPVRSHDWESYQTWDRVEIRGGVEMTRDMLEHYKDAIQVLETRPRATDETPGWTPTLKSLGILKPYDTAEKTDRPVAFKALHPKKRTETQLMRVADFHGYSGAVVPGLCFRLVTADERPDAAPDVIVINDAGNELRFSARSDDNLFYRTFKAPILRGQYAAAGDGAAPGQEPEPDTTAHLVMKMHRPLLRELAWEAFSRARARSKTLILSADDLRLGGVPLSRSPTWDTIVADFRTALRGRNATLTAIAAARARVIILFGVEGALVWDSEDHSQHLDLVFDPMRAEGQVAAQLPGFSVGVMNRFLSTFVHALASADVNQVDQVSEAMKMARLHAETGFDVLPAERKLDYPTPGTLTKDHEARLDKAKPGHDLPNYVSLSVSDDMERPLLERHLLSKAAKSGSGEAVDPYLAEAREIVTAGVETTLATCPHGRFGKLWTVDPEEIAALRAVDRLIARYLADRSINKPISIAVFGPPGSGKSFGVKQLVDRKQTPVREYNLSQASAAELPGFFHEIRDLNLEGKPPLCFFDEFDSQDRDLLKSFLAPMQDGTFLDGGSPRPVGRGIFVFAGGTASTMKAFARHCEPPDRDDEAAWKEHRIAKSKKLPDFVSRLHLHFNVKGPNAVAADNGSDGDDDVPFAERAAHDPSYILRRAILLRRFIEQAAPGVISDHDRRAAIEPGLLDLLLTVEDYRHGARSLELLVKAISQNSDRRSLGRSDLPADSQIEAFVKPMKPFSRMLNPRSAS